MATSVASWRAYATARGNSAPANATDPLATAALLRATDYIKYSYLGRIIAVPPEASVDEATYIAANLELATPNFFSKVFTPGEQKVLTEVKGIKWTPVDRTDTSNAGANATPTSTLIAAIFAPYLPGKYPIGVLSLG